VLKAHGELQRIRRDEAALAELPIAALSSLIGNIHRDPKKGEPFKPADFCLWRDGEKKADLCPQAAAVALQMRADGSLPSIFLTAWQAILSSANATSKPPAVRALRSDDERIYVLAPVWEGKNVRGGLVAVNGQISGTVLLRDVDKPLLTYRVQIPSRQACGWLEGGLLLIGES
jgi:hypothetical protein